MATAIQQRLLDLAADIATSPPDDLAFTHSVLAQTSLRRIVGAPNAEEREARVQVFAQGAATILQHERAAIEASPWKWRNGGLGAFGWPPWSRLRLSFLLWNRATP